METIEIVELIAAVMMALGLGAIIAQRIIAKKSFGARTIQMSAVVLLIPVILILGLEKILAAETLGTLIGGLIGYLLSGIGEYQPSSRSDSTD